MAKKKVGIAKLRSLVSQASWSLGDWLQNILSDLEADVDNMIVGEVEVSGRIRKLSDKRQQEVLAMSRSAASQTGFIVIAAPYVVWKPPALDMFDAQIICTDPEEWVDVVSA